MPYPFGARREKIGAGILVAIGIAKHVSWGFVEFLVRTNARREPIVNWNGACIPFQSKLANHRVTWLTTQRLSRLPRSFCDTSVSKFLWRLPFVLLLLNYPASIWVRGEVRDLQCRLRTAVIPQVANSMTADGNLKDRFQKPSIIEIGSSTTDDASDSATSLVARVRVELTGCANTTDLQSAPAPYRST